MTGGRIRAPREHLRAPERSRDLEVRRVAAPNLRAEAEITAPQVVQCLPVGGIVHGGLSGGEPYGSGLSGSEPYGGGLSGSELSGGGLSHPGYSRPRRGYRGPTAPPALRREAAGSADPLGGSAIPGEVLTALRRRAGSGQRLPAPLATGIGEQLGHDLSHVRVHTDSEADGLARSVQAVAFTHGSDIYFRQGAYAPGVDSGKHLLAHELTHVAQGATAGGAIVGRADDPAEHAAERSADRIVSVLRRQAQRSVHKFSEPGPADDSGPSPVNEPDVRRSAAPTSNDPLRRSLLNNVVGNTVTDLAVGAGLGIQSFGSWLGGAGAGAPTYGPLSSGGFGTGMSVVLPGHPPHYPLPGGQEAGAAIDHPGWNVLTRRKPATGRGNYYVRAHLLRGKFGGRADWQNLVPLTNAANNPSPLSHLNTVEDLIEAAIRGPAGRPVGYRVQPVYSQLPFGVPRLAVNSLAGWLPFLGPLGEIMYWESLIPTALMTSWWYQDSWNPVPTYRLIRNWVGTDADLYRMTIFTPGHGAQDLTGRQLALLAIAELLKLAVVAVPLIAAVTSENSAEAWASALSAPAWSALRPALATVAAWAGVAELVPSDASAVVAVLTEVLRQLPWWSAGSLVESAGQAGMLARPRNRLAGERGGMIPSMGTAAAALAAGAYHLIATTAGQPAAHGEL